MSLTTEQKEILKQNPAHCFYCLDVDIEEQVVNLNDYDNIIEDINSYLDTL